MHALFNPSLFSATLLIWSEQAVVLTAAAALAATAIAHPKGRLLMWQALLLALLLLPVIEPWTVPPPLVAAEPATAIATFSAASIPSAGFHWRAGYWIWFIAAGAALRLLWMAAGFLRLRWYRRQARPLTPPPLRFAAPPQPATAVWYASDSVPGPVTYGWRRPVILLPSKTLELPADLREAIECHELVHVQRKDWLWVVAENVVRSVLWFHPAVWLVVSRIQLAREQVVDREAVRLLQNRERYLDALVAVAGYQLNSDLTPAFLRKRQLLARVEAVVKEIDMTGSRIVASVTAACSILPLAALAAMWLFPFVAPPASIAQVAAQVVTPAPPAPRVPPITQDPLGVLSEIHFSGTTAEAEQEIRSRLALHEGDPVTAQDMRRFNAAVIEIDSRLRVGLQMEDGGKVSLQVLRVPPSPLTQPGAQPVYRPGGGVSNPIPISRPEPQYTEEARKAKWGGTVLLSVVIDENGATKSIKVLKPLGMGLDEKAIEAVSQWTFKPGLKDGVPVPVAAQIEVTFHTLD